jgi:hypothetical protein
MSSSTDVRCPHCDKTFALDSAATAPRRAGDMTCPKCGDPQPEAVACRSCGLLATRMAEFARNRDRDEAPVVRAAWDALEARWDDPAAHDAFLKLVATETAYPWAAQRYREVQRARPDDRRAPEQLARIARMAEATLRATAMRKEKPSETPYRNTILILALMVLLIIGAVAFALVSSRMHGDGPAPAPRHGPAAVPGAPPKPGHPPRPK